MIIRLSLYPPPFVAKYMIWYILNVIQTIFAGSLESVNLFIMAVRNLFKEVVAKKSGFYISEIFKSQ